MTDIPYKQCSTCPNAYPAIAQFFSRDRSKEDGLHTTCKVCEKTRAKAYREAHKDELREKKRIYREANKEQIAKNKKQWQQGESYKDYQKRYQQEHRDEISSQNRRRYQEQLEHRQAKQRAYRLTLQGRAVEKAHTWKRKAQKRASTGSYTAQQLQEQIQRQKHRCYYCKAKLGCEYHVDHIVPLAKGGTNDIHNIVLACPACNLSKHARLPHEWPEGGRLL